ncbi:hypothetical protein GCM10028792_08050 [Salinisphaera aquimarina]
MVSHDAVSSAWPVPGPIMPSISVPIVTAMPAGERVPMVFIVMILCLRGVGPEGRYAGANEKRSLDLYKQLNAYAAASAGCHGR